MGFFAVRGTESKIKKKGKRKEIPKIPKLSYFTSKNVPHLKIRGVVDMQKRLPKQNSKIVKNAFTKSVLTKLKMSKITKIQQRDEGTTMSKIVIISFSKTTFTKL